MASQMASKDCGAIRRSRALSLESAAANDPGDRWESLFDRVEVGAERAKVPAIRGSVGKRSGGCRAADIASAFLRLRGTGGCRRPCGQAGYR